MEGGGKHFDNKVPGEYMYLYKIIIDCILVEKGSVV